MADKSGSLISLRRRGTVPFVFERPFRENKLRSPSPMTSCSPIKGVPQTFPAFSSLVAAFLIRPDDSFLSCR